MSETAAFRGWKAQNAIEWFHGIGRLGPLQVKTGGGGTKASALVAVAGPKAKNKRFIGTPFPIASPDLKKPRLGREYRGLSATFYKKAGLANLVRSILEKNGFCTSPWISGTNISDRRV
jgi:hypothetical protein